MAALARLRLGTAGLAVALLVVLTAGAGDTDAALPCANASRNEARRIYDNADNRAVFDSESLQWRWNARDGARNSSFFVTEPVALARLAAFTRNRRFLFLGDSTARNPAIVLAAMLCNPRSFAECRQIATVHPGDGDMGALACNRSATTFDATSDNSSDLLANEYNTCFDMVQAHVVPLVNITMSEAVVRRLRKRVWEQGKVPPMNRISIPSLNFTIDVVEAGCSSRDGMDAVITTLARAKAASQVDWDLVRQLYGRHVAMPTFDADRNFFAQYSAVILAGGLHCANKRWRGGWWYKRLAEFQLPLIAREAPVVYLELSHCLKKSNRGYDALPGCRQIASHIDPMMLTFTSVPGVYMAPTRNLTRRIGPTSNPGSGTPPTANELRAWNCVFADPVHPGLKCYGPVIFSLLTAVNDAIVAFAALRMRAPECLVPSNAMINSNNNIVSEMTPESMLGMPALPAAATTGQTFSAEVHSPARLHVELLNPSGAPVQRTPMDGTWLLSSFTIVLAVLLFTARGR
jgi:hypothetical protein